MTRYSMGENVPGQNFTLSKDRRAGTDVPKWVAIAENPLP